MWIWIYILLSSESADTEMQEYPRLVARHSVHSTHVELAYVSCHVKAIAFDEFVTDKASLEYHNVGKMDFDTLDFTMPAVSGTSTDKCAFYLESQLCASLWYMRFVGVNVKSGDSCPGVSCRSTFENGLFSVHIRFANGFRSSKVVSVCVYSSQRPSVFCNASGVLEKQYVLPIRNYYRHIRPAIKFLPDFLKNAGGNYKFEFSVNTQNVLRWNIDLRGKHDMKDGAYRVTSTHAAEDIVCVFTAKESCGLLVRHFMFQKHYVLELSSGPSGGARSSHATSPREVVFAIDVSRHVNKSWHTVLFEVLERLLKVITGLEIYVNVVFFNHDAESAAVRSMQISNEDNVLEMARKMKSALFPRGERSVLAGLKKAISLERVRRNGEVLERNVILITSGIDGAADEVMDVVREATRNNIRFFAVGAGKVASYDALAEISRLGRGSCSLIQRSRDAGNCISAVLEKTGSQGHEYDCGSLDVEDKSITSFIMNGRLSLGERPVQVPLKRNEPWAFSCEGLRTYLVFKHGIPDQVELTFEGERHTCRRSEFKPCNDPDAKKGLMKDFMRHINAEFYLLVYKVFSHRRAGYCNFGGEDTSGCLATLENIVEGDAPLVSCLSSEQEDKLVKFAERYLEKYSLHDERTSAGVLCFNSKRSNRVLAELLRTFESETSFKAAATDIRLALLGNEVDALTLARIAGKCREIARENGPLGDTDKKLLALVEAIKVALGPLDRECASAVTYKSAVMGQRG